MENESRLMKLREEMSQINTRLLEDLNALFRVSKQIGREKDSLGVPYFDPARESEMLLDIQKKNRGPVSQDILKHLFKEIFKASVEDMGKESLNKFMVSKGVSGKDSVIDIKGLRIGGDEKPVVIGGPCAVETYDQFYQTAGALKKMGVKLLRGGAFKPRTSPYSFQGLEEEGLKIMRQVADEFDMLVVTEVLEPGTVSLVETYADVIQVGTRNMQNFPLLKRIGKSRKPVLLKRGLMATIDEFILAAEYIYLGGNREIILCERGIRTFEPQTRNTLDISAIPILKKETVLPVVVDVSHSTGRKDIVAPLAKAAIAAGADGIMVECHIDPTIALSDANQQLTPVEFEEIIGLFDNRSNSE